MQQSSVREITEANNFKMAKALGQNFLTDERVEDVIIDALCLTGEDQLIEIGPGTGHLTLRAAEKAGAVKAIELDDRLIPILKGRLALFHNVEIIHKDVLETDLSSLAKCPVILGNLPYYITTPILMKLIEDNISFKRAVFMVQKEVADKLTAPPSGKNYGLLSVIMQQFFTVEQLMTVPAECFLPPPKVTSAVVRLLPNESGRAEMADPAEFISFAKACFAKRRKTLGNSLTGYHNMSKQQVLELLDAVGTDPMKRCEALDPAEFVTLSNKIKENTK